MLALGACLIASALANNRAVFPPWGLSLDYLDASVTPGNDFFRHANGTWLKSAVIPADRRVAGVNLEIDKGNEAKLHTLITTLAAKPDATLSAEERKLRDFYLAFADVTAIEAAGLGPVRADLDRIGALATPAEVAAFMAMPAAHAGGPYSLRIIIDPKNPDAYIVRLSQSGLGMPDRDYYLREDKRHRRRAGGLQEVPRRHAGAGRRAATRRAPRRSLRSKRSIAQAHWPAAERREADKTYNLMSVAELIAFAPQFPWEAYLDAAGVPARAPHGARELDRGREIRVSRRSPRCLPATPVAVWRDYLTVHYLHEHAELLPQGLRRHGLRLLRHGDRRADSSSCRARCAASTCSMSRWAKRWASSTCASYFPPEAKAKADSWWRICSRPMTPTSRH